MHSLRRILAFTAAALFLTVLLAPAAWAVNLNETFTERLFPPPGWQSFENGDGLYTWGYTVGYGRSTPLGAVTDGPENVPSGQFSRRWLITPQLRVNNSTDSIAFWGTTDQSSALNDSLYILVSTTDALPASFTTVLFSYQGYPGFSTSWARKAHSLAAFVGQDIYVAFLRSDEGTGGRLLRLDDITGPELLAPPSVASAPTPANLAYSTLANTSLSWTNGAGTSTVDVYFAQTYDSVNNSIAAAKVVDDQAVATYVPPIDLVAGQEYYWKVVGRNSYGTTQGFVWMFAVTGTSPMSGSYDIGGASPEFPNFTVAVGALYGRGISGPVTFNVYGGDYDEQVRLLAAVNGAGPNDTIKFVDASGTARLRVTWGTDAQEGVIQMATASYFIFDGIDVLLEGSDDDGTYKNLVIKAGSTNNIFRNATWTGSGFTGSSVKHAVYMWGTPCEDNVFDNILFNRHKNGFNITGSSTNQHARNVIRNCTFDNVWQAVVTNNTPDIRIYDNDIQCNAAGGSSTYGIDIAASTSGNTFYIYRNKFHGLIASGSPASIRASGGTGTVVNIYNNWFYDVQTIGSANPCFGLYASGAGTSNFSFNSVYINDVASTGSLRAIYNGSSSATMNIRNNIFYSAETSALADMYYSGSSYVPAILDYNAYYNAGSNANYRVYRTSGANYANLAALQAATAYEDHGVEGNPGYYSASNLHIDSTYNLVSNIGLHIDGIDDDIDQDPRSAGNPDIGSDEYTFLAPPADYAVTEILNTIYLNAELTLKHPRARVANRGSAAQTDVPVILFYNDTPQDTILVSLAVDEVDTIEFDWTTPSAPQLGTLEAQSFLTGDADLSNDSAQFAVRIVGQPMHGTYDIGGGSNHYPNFSSAVDDLTLREMDGAVIFDVYNGTYVDSLHMGPITGASETNTITFQKHSGDVVTLTWASGLSVVRLNGADYVTLDGINITATGACARGVQIFGNADYNAVKNATIIGSNVASTTTFGVHVSSTSTGNDDYNTFDNLTISGAGYGIYLSGLTSAVDVGNEVKNCAILEGKYGIRTEYQRGGRVHDCDIQPGWSTAATDIYGLYVSSQVAGDTVFHYGNKIHNIRTGAGTGAVGIYTVAATALIYNNFVYDFQVAGTAPIFAIRVFGGSPEIYFNSVYIGDVATTGGTSSTGHINGFFETTSSSSAILKNNIFQIDEPTDTCFAINRNNGTLAVSDYNCVFSSIPGTGYFMGRDGTTNYPTLASWQGAFGRDLNSFEGNPGFMSTTDLHILATYNLLNGTGTPIDGIAFDIDNDARGGTPDIGADEYAYTTFDHDYGVIRFLGLLPSYTGTIPTVIRAEVKNWGTNNETDVPVRLYYNNVQQDVVLVSLLAGELDTVELDWTPPDVGYEEGELKVTAFCPSDGYALDDSRATPVIIVGGPMHDIYDLGGGNMDFATFNEAVAALYLRSIDAEVIFDVYGGTYNESVDLIDPIPGANFTDRVIFRARQTPLNDIVTLTSSSDSAAILIDSCDFVTFDGIDVVCTGATNVGYYVDDDADYVTIKNAVITGRDSTLTAVRGIIVSHDLCDNVTIDGCTISGCYYGIMMFVGRTNTESSNIEIMNCAISGGNYNVFLDNSPGARCHHNMLQPSGTDATDAQGVLIESQNAGDSVFVYANKIYNMRRFSRTTSNLSAIQARPGTGAFAYVYNNMIWGHNLTDPRLKGRISGILCGTGNVYAYHNSIHIADLGMHPDSLGVIAGISVTSTSSSTATLLNNIIVNFEDDDSSYCVHRPSTNVMTSDYNCFNGTRVGYTGGTSYATLGAWQGLGFDTNSLYGDPGFISSTDLHIDSTNTLCNNVGFAVAEVTVDIDGENRNDPPDIGADEFHGLVTPDVVDSLTIFPDWENSNVLLRWTPANEANSYKIYAGTVVDFPIDETTYVATVAGTTYTHTGALTAGSAKFYVVVASTDQPAR